MREPASDREDIDRPALMGGRPVRPTGPPTWPGSDPAVVRSVQDALVDGSWGVYLGPHVARLEADLARLFAIPHAITCASGTLAMEMALRAIGVGPGTEVVMSAYDFEPTFLSVHALGATPVLVDSAPGGVGLDPAKVEAALTHATRAIIVSHLHGELAAIAAVRQAVDGRDIRIIEDAAQCPGARLAGQPVATTGDIGILSFGGSKPITAGRGGALLTRRDDLAQRIRLALSRGIQTVAPLSELQAAALAPQLAVLPDRAAERRRYARKLLDLVTDLPGLRPLCRFDLASEPDFYKLGFWYDATAFGLPRSLFVAAMRAEGIAFDAGYRALHVGRSPRRYRAVGSLTNVEKAGEAIVVLHHPVLALGESGVAEVAVALRKTYRNRELLSSAGPALFRSITPERMQP